MNVMTSQPITVTHAFTLRLSSTRRGARLARLTAVEQLRTWPLSPCVTDRAEQVVAELAANAALHGRVPGRDFRLALTLGHRPVSTLRIAVTDARGEQLPVVSTDFLTPVDTEGGRGLLLATALADRWGTDPYPPCGKTVWAEIEERDTSGDP